MFGPFAYYPFALAATKSFIVGVLILLLVPIMAQAQEEDDEATTEYESEYNYGLMFYTKGGLIGGISLKYAKERKPGLYNRFQLEFANMKHPKEFRARGVVSTFIPNKYQYLLAIRPSFGQEIRLFRKAPEEGVQLNAIIAAGPTFGITKPYYVLYADSTNGDAATSRPYNPSLNLNRIVGAGGITDGLDQLGIVPGLHARAGLAFESGKARSSVFGLEGGMLAEIYSRPVELLKFQGSNASAQTVKNPRGFFALYLILYYGKKQ